MYIDKGIVSSEKKMSIFDMICVGVLVLYAGGYIWVKITRDIAPPSEDE